MKRNKIRIVSAALFLTCAITACGTKYPEITDAQYDDITEYAAGLLLQHSYNSINRLTDIDSAAAGLADSSDNISRIGTSASQGSSLTGESQQMAETRDSTQTGGTNQTAAQNGNSAGVEGSNASAGNSLSETSSLADLKEAFSGLDISYSGYSVMKSYPSEYAQGAVYSNAGNSLIVVSFKLINNTDKAIELNMHSKPTSFRLSFGDDSHYTLVTMLSNDLSTYTGSIDANSSQNVVLMTELSDEASEAIDGMSLRVKNKDIDTTVELEN